jgi:molybdopterin converting factor small subunit
MAQDQLGIHIVDGWQIVGYIISAALAWVLYQQRIRMKKTETETVTAKATAETTRNEANAKIEQVRAESAESMAMLTLLEKQISGTARLADAIGEQNKIIQLNGKQHSDAMVMIAESGSAAIHLSQQMVRQLATFQEFSREQHARTRGVIADTAQETVEKLSENLEQIKTELQSVRVVALEETNAVLTSENETLKADKATLQAENTALKQQLADRKSP